MGCGCQKSYSDYIIGSPEEVTVHVLLQPDTVYLWELTDGQKNIYHQEFTTDSDGFGVIDMSGLPEGFANAYQAPLTIRVKVADSECTYVPLVIAQRFLQIQMSFRAGTGNKDWIACPIQPPGPSESIFMTTEEGDTIITEEGDFIIT